MTDVVDLILASCSVLIPTFVDLCYYGLIIGLALYACVKGWRFVQYLIG